MTEPDNGTVERRSVDRRCGEERRVRDRRRVIEGEQPDIGQLVAALEARTESFDALSRVISENTRQLDLIHDSLRVRPTRAQVDYQRLRSVVLVVFFAIAVIFLHDEHIENCGPGVESKAIVREIITNPNFDVDRLREVGRESTPGWCSVASPLHTHDDERGWPQWQNLMGLVLYLSAGGALWLWVRSVGRQADRQNQRVSDIDKSRYEAPRTPADGNPSTGDQPGP